jgi:hypothetical protein
MPENASIKEKKTQHFPLAATPSSPRPADSVSTCQFITFTITSESVCSTPGIQKEKWVEWPNSAWDDETPSIHKSQAVPKRRPPRREPTEARGKDSIAEFS